MPYISPRVLQSVYAVRGMVPTRALQIQSEITSEKSHSYKFNRLVFCNIGNPQALGSTPITFPRQVLSLFDCPTFLDNPSIVCQLPKDVVARATSILQMAKNITGAYTESAGFQFVRESVAEFITARDRVHCPSSPAADPSNIFLTDGASPAVKAALQLLVNDVNDAVMIPIPQYPLYTATISLLGGTPAMYFLNEENNWGLSLDELERSYTDAKSKGVTPRLLVVINPGNPTGQVLTVLQIKEVLEFAHKHNLVVLADEVYQENIYGDKVFHSFREVLYSCFDKSVYENLSLLSVHSTSKGILGECGRRGGYLETVNISSEMKEQLIKLMSINLCSNVDGQIMVDLLVKPPKEGEESHLQYKKEHTSALQSLRQRAHLLHKELSTIPGIQCQPIEGAMYAFPSLQLPAAYLEYNNQKNIQEKRKIDPDARWALELLEETGIVVVPGSGFGQKEGTYHFRTTILPPVEDVIYMASQIRAFHMKLLKQYN